MTGAHPAVDRDLQRASRRLGKPAGRFAVLAIALAAPAAVLIALGDQWVRGVGIALAALAGAPAVVALGLALSSLVAWWRAHGRSFA
ncbi:MAG TPA: hypothetical protein VHX88_05705 [Solirubrobacteraceae bacterium]|jgi:hypothetical protein|nr:hypothetical protein [Solirubrobacteraceae bacterium]